MAVNKKVRACKKKKISKMAIVRRAIQLIFFILMPGLFISAFSSIKIVYMALINGTFDFSALLPELAIIFAVIPVTILMGRFFCGFVCSFGALGDLVWFVSRKIRKKPVIIPEKADRVLKLLKYALLIFIVVFIWTLGSVSFDNSLNPWNTFGMLASFSGWPAFSALLTVGALLLLLIMAGSFFIERFFCRYLCPLGAIFAVLSRLRIFKVKKPQEGCKTCRVCTNGCAMGIPMYKYDKISSGECIDCFECISDCPRKNTQASIAGKDAAPLAAGIAATAAIMGLYYVGKLATDSPYAEAVSPMVSEGAVAGDYIDGVYTGSAAGYRGETTVRVTVENGYISDIEVLSTGDDSDFFSRAKNTVIEEIIKAQSAEVDAVTGATYSSYAIMDAVADALSITIDTSAAPAETPVATETPAAAVTPAPTAQEATPAATTGMYTDGVYTGTGAGYRGDTVVSVTVSGGVITGIEIVSYQDDREYFSRASAVVDDILAAQSTNVDAVSGATFSSNSIMEAVANALSADFTAVQPSAEGGGNGWHGGRG